MSTNRATEAAIQSAFANRQVDVVDIESRSFPQEVHHIVYVRSENLDAALAIGNSIDLESEGGVNEFVIVREAPEAIPGGDVADRSKPIRSVHDDRCNQLVKLVSARSRVSASQPSLAYVPDAMANVAAVTAARHNLIFGRRGAGKTALLVEARRQLEDTGNFTAWTNIQTLRRESAQRVILYVLDEVMSSLTVRHAVDERSNLSVEVAALSLKIKDLLDAEQTNKGQVESLVPRVHRTLRDYLSVVDVPLYIFLDDFYYLPRQTQPEILDLLHGCVRDVNAWLKIASIRHLTRWWQASPPVGLQSGQDADLIDLDLTLQQPSLAQGFLEGVLQEFARTIGIPALTRVFRQNALDRLVIASGAVPRDYLVLATSAISRAQRRPKARFVGVQEVNQAAGDAAASKIQELEEDMASNAGAADVTINTLKEVRDFCLEKESFTYFLVGFRDRENNPGSYNLLTALMDVRLIHLVDAGVSEAHAAGQRSEAFMLDLSQYSGARLKQKIRVLDFSAGHFVSRETRSAHPPRVARTPRELVAMLRSAPTLGGEHRGGVGLLEVLPPA